MHQLKYFFYYIQSYKLANFRVNKTEVSSELKLNVMEMATLI